MRNFISALVGLAAIHSGSTIAEAADWQTRLARERGFEAVIWSLPAVSMIALRDAYFSLGGDYNTVYYLTKPPTALQEALTPNNQTPYVNVLLSTRQGPVVLDIPPASKQTAIFGSATDVWQVPVTDIGPAGQDKGKGGRYLFLPPGYKGEVPEGYLPVQLELYDVFVALRLIPLRDTSFSEAGEYAKKISAYPLNEADNPPAGTYIDISGKHLPTLPTYDIDFFIKIDQLIQNEPLLERDKVMGGMLSSLGIEKGTTFKPDPTLKDALNEAAKDGYAYLEHMFETPGYSTEVYWPGAQWLAIRRPSEDGFVYDEGDTLLLDERGSLFHWATFVPRQLGKATAYVMATRDADGELLSGKGVYKLRVPAKVPASDFWSVIAYSKKTKAFIYNDIDRVGLSSYDKEALKTNDDGSVDIYFGETAPKGFESNWIPTAGEDFFLLFRLYGPEDPFFDKSFKLPDVERVS